MAKEKLMERARDELFSHINRCGVLQAERDDQESWMTETIGYIGERYPDLSDGDLQALHQVGIRFCKPAIPHGDPDAAETAASEKDATAPAAAKSAVEEEPGDAEVDAAEAGEDANAA